jgi:O-antigen ligase
MGASIKQEQTWLFRSVAAVLIGGAPVWMVLMIGDLTDRRGGWPIFIRSNSLVVPFLEFVLIMIAMAVGFSPFQAIRKLPRLTKIAISIWILVSAIVSFQQGNDYLSAIIGFMKLFLAGLFLLALVELRRATQDKLFATIWFGIGCAVPAYILLWSVLIAITGAESDLWFVQIPGVNNIRHVGHFAFAGFFAGVACLISFRDNANAFWRWCVPMFFASSALGLALWTGSRGPTLAVTAGMALVILLGAGFRRQLCLFFASSALIATAVVANLPIPHPTYGITRATGIADVEADASHDESSGRTKLWTASIEKIKQKPVFGWGVGQFSEFGPTDWLGMLHPHNFLLQLLFQGGVVSVLLSIFVVAPALRCWGCPNLQGIGLAGTGSVAGIIVYSMYDGALYFSYPIMIFLLAIATSVRPSGNPPPIGKIYPI